MIRPFVGGLLLATFLLSVSFTRAAGPVDFNREVRPLLAKRCFSCHGLDEAERKGGLRLDVRDSAIVPAESGESAIVPGSPDKSSLITHIISTDDAVRMPPADKDVSLSPAEIDILRRWIAEGASYAAHWSFVGPTRPALPAINLDRADSSIDAFTFDRMQQASLEPSPLADNYQLGRRLSLDLTGLPLTMAEVDTFAGDVRDDAHERLVDRLLAAPSYGERWARVWLDLARYADSTGYASDPLRPTIWRYRDWVIDALNQNKPYDAFTIEQLAGDLLPNATPEQTLATAFHRNTMTNTEGGTDDEEYRVIAIKDRATTSVQVWMGLTFGCAQCHNHKYDPLTQKEFYRVYAFFNQTIDSDKPDDQPTRAVPTPQMLDQVAAIDGQIAKLRESLNISTEELARDQREWEASLGMVAGWQVIKPTAVQTTGSSALTPQEDDSILVSGTATAHEVYTVEADGLPAGLTGIRLEALPHPSFPQNGPGRASDGNFVLSHISLETADVEKLAQPIAGQFIRIDLPGTGKMLSLAEVQVYSGETNIAREGKATQVSTAFDGEASRAIDGNMNGDYFAANSVTHTATQDDPWWELDLGKPSPIDKLAIWNRTGGGGLEERLAGAVIRVLDANRKELFSTSVTDIPRPMATLAVSGWKASPIAAASASYSQRNFPVMNAVHQPDLAKSGWGIGPNYNQTHTAWFSLAEPTSGQGTTRARIRLEHHAANASLSLGHFRLAVTNDASMVRRGAVPPEMLAIVDKPATERSPDEVTKLTNYYQTISPRLEPIRKQIAELEKSKPVGPTVPVMAELPNDQKRKSHLMVKGNFLIPGEEVSPGVPASLHPFKPEYSQDRLGLARWIVDPANSLTSRVAMNRMWAQLFGRGIVETEEDFGTQGEPPTHPELLDSLAVEFTDREWDVKRMTRLLVTSTTYRQTSRVTADRLEKDPSNRWLSRAPRKRLDAETVRDQAMSLSGLLSVKMMGSSVFPYQPAGLWQAAFNGSDRTWATSKGEDRFRRGVYTFWRRTIPYPSMAAFDAPSREVCTLRRPNTNTPLQAFVTMNDPVYVEASQALGRRLAKEGGTTTADRVRYGLMLCLGRPAEDRAVETLVKLYEDELAHYRSSPEKAEKIATDPVGPLPEGMDASEAAALTILGNVLLNLDGVLTKG